MRSNDFERLRQTLEIAQAALARIAPQITGALCVQDVEYARTRLQSAITFFAD